MDKATFGAGCFWGVEAAFRMRKGIVGTVAGYTGGYVDSPTYSQVCGGRTGHVEALQITFDQKKISYERLLEIFWQIHDPTLENRQGNDVGPQYQAVIFYHNEAQRIAAEKSKEDLEKSGTYDEAIVTQIRPLDKFYPAEEEHQRYLEKHPGGYCHIDLKSIH
ncbi:MAG: peptide-methionine (S)-S-oxide reductase MsrA [Candidatus Berkelbacteria bacterium]|nr:MAG: peptide-methionine (S)-S-oxide reductase MsrA [Candidatus Berkelbacteria bacterium]QQG51785.1 MAG: peptide-methionine (S)-S-oxide reductase MsrA [Candidatus Berkelbacteria bacterium]